MSFLWILVAFMCGFAVRLVGLPPLVGFLVAGFGLNFLGVQPAPALQTLADMGITLMLFTIGLKINLRELLKSEVVVGGTGHVVLWTVLASAGLLIFSLAGLMGTDFASLREAGLFCFALAFSSTVCVIKILEEQAELKTRHGKLAISILVIQDIIAVVFLAVAEGSVPHPAAILLPLVFLLAPVIGNLLNRSGHDELLPLMGFLLAMGGYELFSGLSVKGDLGALVMGMVIATHPKSAELYKSLMSFKDIFLIGFFLSIGFIAIPDSTMLIAACLLLLALPLKFALFIGLLGLLGMRIRTNFLTATALTNYSEFGLIVAALSVSAGWMAGESLVIIAIAVAGSFVISSYLYPRAHLIYAHRKQRLQRWQKSSATGTYSVKQPPDAHVFVVGMGRVGKGAYDTLEPSFGSKAWGVEADATRVDRLRRAGYDVVHGDAEDVEFWEYVDLDKLKLIMLALPSTREMKPVLNLLRELNYRGNVAALARYDDESQELIALGADVVFNYYTEVGAGFAEQSRHLLDALD